ncbi:MAG: hypothetical protein U0572_13225 [Phycisphaerales bacterium]
MDAHDRSRPLSPTPTASSADHGSGVDVRIERGCCWAYFAFDVGLSIDLDAAQRALSRSRPTREALSGQRRTPESLQFRPAPLQTTEETSPIRLGAFETAPSVQCTCFDFGAVAVAFRISLADLALPALVDLAHELYECRALLDAARQRVRALVEVLGDAVATPNIVDIVEDYVVFHAERWSVAGEPSDAVDATRILGCAPTIAAILRAADERLSDDEVSDATASCVSYGRHDITIVDWNAALVFDQRGQDTLTVLEFGNVELLEMRFLDDRLDVVLDRAYQGLSRRPMFRAAREELRRLAALQMESALLFEGINNAVKLVGDQFLARVYRLVARRFHLSEWDESVIRKLETLQRLYEKFSDERNTRRMEVLEWIIIVLIAVSIVLPFVTGAGH